MSPDILSIENKVETHQYFPFNACILGRPQVIAFTERTDIEASHPQGMMTAAHNEVKGAIRV